MVYHHYPQVAASGNIHTNTNYPPQSGGENNIRPPVVGIMQYEDFEAMQYEFMDPPPIEMEYEE